MHKTINTSATTKTVDPQRGSIIVLTVGVVLIGLFLLGTIQLGYTFYMKRTLQNAADLAVISGAQALYSVNNEPDCQRATETAQAILTQNLKHHSVSEQPLLQCGEWTSTIEQADDRFTPNTTSPNAVRVHVQHALPMLVPFMSQNAPIAASAIAVSATTQPVAAFSVGPRLLDINNGILSRLLEHLGLDIQDANVLSHQGLANVGITPSGLLRELGIDVPLNVTVADLHQLLDAHAAPTLLASEILDASIALADSQGLLDADKISVLNALTTSLRTDDFDLRLFANEATGAHGVFSLSSIGSDPAGLNAQVGVADILEVVLSAATQKHALELIVPKVNVVELLAFQTHVRVIEPPSIGIGPTGTTAHSANIRAFTRLCLLDGCDSEEPIPLGLLSILVNIGVDLPIVIELVNGTGTLGSMCHPDTHGQQQAEISVDADLLTACIGNFNDTPGSANNAFSTTKSCAQRINANHDEFEHKLLNIKLLSLLNVPIRDALTVSTVSPTHSSHFSVGETRHLPESGAPNLGTAINGLLQQILGAVPALSLPLVGSILSPVTSLLSNLLAPALNGLTDELTNNLLEPLGLDLGRVETTLISLDCEPSVRLVH